MSPYKQPIAMVAIVLLTLGVAMLTYVVDQHHFYSILLSYSVAFGGFIILTYRSEWSWRFGFLMVICLSAIIVPAWPSLSDDIFRFMWDGALINQGINPYLYKPVDFIDTVSDTEMRAIFYKLNSPQYFSVYPLTCQFIFAVGDSVAGWGIPFHMTMKLIYICIHMSGYYFAHLYLTREKVNSSSLIYYYLNPLVIVEGIGNLHAEVVMVSFFIIGLYYFNVRKFFISALFIGLAIATKMTLLMVLPILCLFAFNQRQWRFIFWIIFLSMLLFSPILLTRSSGFVTSLDLYFRKFEFNASIYYLLRWAGNHSLGYNLIAYIGPLLALVTMGSIMKLTILSYQPILTLKKMAMLFTLILVIHMLCSTTIHPWYLITPIFFASICNLKSVIIWSFTITWSYIHYHKGAFVENHCVIALEYLLVLISGYYLGDVRKINEMVIGQAQ